MFLHAENMLGGYGETTILNHCSVGVKKGEIAVIVGPNGAGKSTAMKAIFGMLNLIEGSVFFDNHDITTLSPQDRVKRGMGFVPQTNNVFTSMTVLENLMVAGSHQVGENIFNSWFSTKRVKSREKEILNKGLDSLEFLGLTNLKDELAGNLSGGQKKLLELGRTMMTDAKLVLLDEPGAGVNPTLMLKIIDMIRRLNIERGYTFCIIEHDMDLIADLCQKVVVLSEGQVLTEGTMSNVKNDERVIQAYFGGGVNI